MPVMNPPATGAPVHNLQRMLRTLTNVHREIPLLSPNGIFGEETLEAVMIFQRLTGLPVNGTVDQRTWDALVEEHHRVSHLLAPPRTAALFPQGTAPIQPGQTTPLLYPIQGMLLALAGVLADLQSVPPSGVLDTGTAANFRRLQRWGSFPETGALDRDTWELLSHLYETFISRNPQNL